jgi:hypothetical protein
MSSGIVDVEAMRALEKYVNEAFSHEIPLDSDNDDASSPRPAPETRDVSSAAAPPVQLRTNSRSLWRTRSHLPSFMATDRRHWIKYCGWIALCVVAGVLAVALLFAAGGFQVGGGNGTDNQQITWPSKNKSRFVIVDVAGVEEPVYGQPGFENGTNVSQ